MKLKNWKHAELERLVIAWQSSATLADAMKKLADLGRSESAILQRIAGLRKAGVALKRIRPNHAKKDWQRLAQLAKTAFIAYEKQRRQEAK